MHHPLVMECGDPRGDWGRGFVPISESYLHRTKEKELSIFTCHVPLDHHIELGTNAAIAHALGATMLEQICYDDGWLCEINKHSTDQLIEKLRHIFDIPYVDFEGRKYESIEKIAVIAGCGDKVEMMKEAERKGAQAYITGEVHCHIDNEYGRQKYKIMKQYVANTSMSLIGVSHSASEFLVKKTLMKDWFEKQFSVKTVLLPQKKWWF